MTVLPIVLALAYAGLCAFSLAMNRHHRQCWGFGVTPLRARLLRLAGCGALAAGLIIAIAREGMGHGLVLALTSAGSAAIAVVLLMAYRPRVAAAAALFAPPAALALVLTF